MFNPASASPDLNCSMIACSCRTPARAGCPSGGLAIDEAHVRSNQLSSSLHSRGTLVTAGAKPSRGHQAARKPHSSTVLDDCQRVGRLFAAFREPIVHVALLAAPASDAPSIRHTELKRKGRDPNPGAFRHHLLRSFDNVARPPTVSEAYLDSFLEVLGHESVCGDCVLCSVPSPRCTSSRTWN